MYVCTSHLYRHQAQYHNRWLPPNVGIRHRVNLHLIFDLLSRPRQPRLCPGETPSPYLSIVLPVFVPRQKPLGHSTCYVRVLYRRMDGHPPPLNRRFYDSTSDMDVRQRPAALLEFVASTDVIPTCPSQILILEQSSRLHTR